PFANACARIAPAIKGSRKTTASKSNTFKRYSGSGHNTSGFSEQNQLSGNFTSVVEHRRFSVRRISAGSLVNLLAKDMCMTHTISVSKDILTTPPKHICKPATMAGSGG